MTLLKQYPVLLMSPPFGLSASEPNNAFMKELSPTERQVDREKALRQWLEVYNFLASMSLVALLPQAEGLQDQSYVANLAVVLTHLPDMPIVVSNFTAEERKGEQAPGRAFLESLRAGPVVTCPYRFEGDADCKLIRDNIYAVGVGSRTSGLTANWFADQYKMQVIPIRMRDPKAYHLDCLIFPIDSQKTLAFVSIMDPSNIKMLERVTEITPTPTGMYGATNLVRVDRNLLCGTSLWNMKHDDEDYNEARALVEFVTKVAADNRLEPQFFDLSEFSKSGADISCLVLSLNKPYFAD